LVGVLALGQMGNIRDAAQSIFVDNLTPSHDLATVDGINSDILSAALRANIAQDDAVNKAMLDRIESLREEAKAPWGAYSSTVATGQDHLAATPTPRPTGSS
jgi:hypothetical protein